MFKAKPYINPNITEIKRGVWDFLLWCFGRYKDPFRANPPPKGFSFPYEPRCDFTKPTVSWINHSSFLLDFEGCTILTDPVFSDRCCPIPGIGPFRKHPPGLPLTHIEGVDFVLISHNHYDHLDAKSVLAIHKKFPYAKWIVPRGLQKWFIKRGIHKVTELNWWEEILFHSNSISIKVTAVPAQHFSGRGIFDKNKTLWNGYVVECVGQENRKAFYFVGDTGYNTRDFKKIGKRWEIDLALIPIGTYRPCSFMKPVHISPEEAVQIHQEVQAKKSIGMHWKTFCLSEEPMNRPPYDLFLQLEKKKIPCTEFFVIEPGTFVNW